MKLLSRSAENSPCVGIPLLLKSCCKLFSSAQHLGLNPARCWTIWPQSSKALRQTFNIAENATPLWLMSLKVPLHIRAHFFSVLTKKKTKKPNPNSKKPELFLTNILALEGFWMLHPQCATDFSCSGLICNEEKIFQYYNRYTFGRVLNFACDWPCQKTVKCRIWQKAPTLWANFLQIYHECISKQYW